jgi:ubiquinone/menaquinone biosynthesis C-methylase UbiE
MDPRIQRRVQRYGWDKAATHYEGFWAKQLEPAQQSLLALSELQPGERVLDVACGTGLVTFPALDAVGSGGHVVGSDISGEMVTTITSEAKKRGYDNASFERSDAEELGFPDASFDVVLCGLGLMYVTDPRRSLAEMYRVLRPEGRAVSAVWGARGLCGWAEIFPIVDARVESDVCPMFFQLGTGEALRMVYEGAGFENVVTERLSTTLHYESADAALGAAFVGGPVALAYSRFDDTTRAEAHAEYLASIEPFLTNGRYEIPGEFVIVRGDKRRS